jgi:hypothetical protein
MHQKIEMGAGLELVIVPKAVNRDEGGAHQGKDEVD